MQGEIKHLYKGFGFISSKLVLENGGIFVSKARNLVLAGGGKVTNLFYLQISLSGLFSSTILNLKPLKSFTKHKQPSSYMHFHCDLLL